MKRQTAKAAAEAEDQNNKKHNRTKIQHGTGNDLLKLRLICLKYLMLFALLCVFYFYLPYSYDDWVWGSPYAIDTYLSSWFDHYNGRYVGNLLILGLTRNHIVRMLYMAGMLTLYVWLTDRIIRRDWAFRFVLLALFFMPREILRQTLAWTSGYVNYVTSAIPPLILLLDVSPLFEHTEESRLYRWQVLKAVLFIPLFFAGALIMENVTLFLVLFLLFLILYEWICLKKILLRHLTALAGCLTGALYMFSNTAYGILRGGENLQSRRVISESFFRHALQIWTTQMYGPLFRDCLFVLIAADAALLILYVRRRQKKYSAAQKSLLFRLQGMPLLCFTAYTVWETAVRLIHLAGFQLYAFEKADSVLTIFGILTFACAVITECAIQIQTSQIQKAGRRAQSNSRTAQKMDQDPSASAFSADNSGDGNLLKGSRDVFPVVLLASIMVLAAPLFAVDPVSARCFFLTYTLLFLLAGRLFGFLPEPSAAVRRAAAAVECIAVTACTLFFAYIYGENASADLERLSSIRRQTEDGLKQVSLNRLPFENYLYYPTPYDEWYQTPERYKDFYGLDQDLVIHCVPYDTPDPGIFLAQEYMLFTDDEPKQLEAESALPGLPDPRLIWTSSDPEIASVDDSGLVTPVSKGRCTVTGTVDGTAYTASCDVNVSIWLAKTASLDAAGDEDGVLLTWEKVDGAYGYQVYAGRSKRDIHPITYLEGEDTLSWLDTDASYEDYTYYLVYPVRMVDGTLERGIGDQYAYDIKRLPAVSGISVQTYIRSGQYSDVSLSWKPIEGADGYRIVVSRGEKGELYNLASVTEPEFTDVDAPAGVTSYYWVSAYRDTSKGRAAGIGGDYVQATIPAEKELVFTEPVMPEIRISAGPGSWSDQKEQELIDGEDGNTMKGAGILARTLKKGILLIQWEPIHGADGYVVVRNGQQLDYTMGTTYYIDMKADDRQLSYYSVIPYIKSEKSNIMGNPGPSIFAVAHPVDQVRRVRARNLKNEVRLTWDAAEGASGYVVLRKDDEKDSSFEPIAEVTDVCFNDSPENGTWYYRVYGTYADEQGTVIAVGTASPQTRVLFEASWDDRSADGTSEDDVSKEDVSDESSFDESTFEEEKQ